MAVGYEFRKSYVVSVDSSKHFTWESIIGAFFMTCDTCSRAASRRKDWKKRHAAVQRFNLKVAATIKQLVERPELNISSCCTG